MNNYGSVYLGLLGVVLLVLFIYLTGVVGIFFVTIGGLWLLSRGNSKLWVQAIASVLLAVTIGLAILCLALFVLNGFKETFDPDWVHSAEDSLYSLLLNLKIINSSTLTTILILLILIAVSYYLPHWKLVSKYLWLKKALETTVIVLGTITSFTFFGQFPTNEWVVHEHDKMVERYRAALRQQWQFEGQALSAQALENHVRDLDEPRRHFYRTVYSTIKSDSYRNGTDYTGVVSEHMADLQSERTKEALDIPADRNILTTEIKLPGEELIEHPPETTRERSRQLEVLEEQELRTKTAEIKATEAFTGLKKIFSEVVISEVPGIDGIAGSYLRKLVANYSELLFEKSVAQYHRQAAQAGVKAPVLASEMVQAAKPEPQLAKQLLEPRLPSGTTELAVVGVAAMTPLLRSQITQAVQRMTRTQVDTAIAREAAKRATLASRAATSGSSGSYKRSARLPRFRLRARGR